MPIMPSSMRFVPIVECWPMVSEIMLKDRDVPALFGDCAANLLQTEAVKQVSTICDDAYERGGLVMLVGPPGAGKSFAAYALACLGYLRHGYNFIGYQAHTLFGMAWQDATKAEYNDAWVRPATLIIDELGGEGKTKSGALDANLYAGLNHRYANKLPTIITSNFAADDLARLYPDFTARMESRFREWATVLEIKVPDMRAAIAAEVQE